MLTVYAFGNGYLLYGMFQAIALFFKFNNIGVLFTALGLIGTIYYGMRVTFTHQGSLLSTAKYFLGFFIVLSVLVYNTTTVIVTDVSNPAATTNAQPISNVPWGVAELWSDFTTIQYTLVEDFTTAFSTPTGDNLLSMGVGVSMLQQEDSATISTANSYLFEDYNQYISNCIAPGISAGYLNVSDLLSAGNATNSASLTYGPNQANNIWTIMSNYSSDTASGGGGNLLTEWYSGNDSTSNTFNADGSQAYPNGISTNCAQETTWLETAINSYIQNNLEPSMAGELQFASVSELSNALGQMNPYLFNMQQTGQAQLTQAIGVNMYAPAILKMAQTSGASASSLAVATGEGTTSTQTGMIESGIMAGRYMPIVFGIFEALMLGASIIVLILITTHMGTKYIKLLFEILIMITIWPSLTAVFNYVSQLIIQAQYAPLSGMGYSVSDSGEINSFLASSLAWMGYFSWSVPMVAYAIASGSSYAMTSMVAGMDSAISRGSSIKGASAGIGNLTSGTVRSDNYLANKWDVTHTQNNGIAPQKTQESMGVHDVTGQYSNGVNFEKTYVDGKLTGETLTRGGDSMTLAVENGHLEVVRSDMNIKGMDEKSFTAAAKRDLVSEDKKLASEKEAVTNSAAQTDSAISLRLSEHGKSRSHGVDRNASVSSGNKVGNQNNYDTKGTASAGGGIGGVFKGVLSAVLGFNTSDSLMNSVGSASGAGSKHAIQHQMHRLEILKNAHLGEVSVAAAKELKALQTYENTLTKSDAYKHIISEGEQGKLDINGSIMPSIENKMTKGDTGSAFAQTFNKLESTGASMTTLDQFVSTYADKYKNNNSVYATNAPKITAGANKLKLATGSLSPKKIAGKVATAFSSNNNELSNLQNEYNIMYNNASLYYKKRIAPQDFIQAPTAGNIRPGNTVVNHVLYGVNDVVQFGTGFGDGVLLGGNPGDAGWNPALGNGIQKPGEGIGVYDYARREGGLLNPGSDIQGIYNLVTKK